MIKTLDKNSSTNAILQALNDDGRDGEDGQHGQGCQREQEKHNAARYLERGQRNFQHIENELACQDKKQEDQRRNGRSPDSYAIPFPLRKWGSDGYVDRHRPNRIDHGEENHEYDDELFHSYRLPVRACTRWVKCRLAPGVSVKYLPAARFRRMQRHTSSIEVSESPVRERSTSLFLPG